MLLFEAIFICKTIYLAGQHVEVSTARGTSSGRSWSMAQEARWEMVLKDMGEDEESVDWDARGMETEAKGGK